MNIDHQPTIDRINDTSSTSRQRKQAMTSPHLDDSLVEVLKYPDGINYEYHEPPFVEVEGGRHRPSLDELTGTYDVVLHAEHWVGDKLTTVRGGTLVVERTAGGGQGHRDNVGVFRFDISFGDCDCDRDDPPRDDGDDPRDLSFTIKDNWTPPSRGGERLHVKKSGFDIPPSPGAVSTCGRVRIVEERSPLFLLRSGGDGDGGDVSSGVGPSNGGGAAADPASDERPRCWYLLPPPGDYDEDEDERRRRGEEVLARYRDGSSHWLHAHTPLPAEVVGQVLRYLYPPPVWSYEAGDLWIEGFWMNSCPLESWYHDWRYVARRRRSDGPTE